jgi:hypothetical protein
MHYYTQHLHDPLIEWCSLYKGRALHHAVTQKDPRVRHHAIFVSVQMHTNLSFCLGFVLFDETDGRTVRVRESH